MMPGMDVRRSSGWVLIVGLVATLVVAALAAPGGAASRPPGSQAADGAAATTGSWSVRAVAGGRYEVAWTSPTAFPITSDRPTILGPTGAQVGVSTIAADGRTVHAVVTSRTRPTPATLAVELSGDRLDQPGRAARRTAAPEGRALDLPGTETLPVDPATPGPFGVTSSDYQLDPVKLPGMPEPIEMVGHVVEPAAGAATGPRPLVLLLHGRHNYCYDPSGKDEGDSGWPCRAPWREVPSHLGYRYVQRVLASQGYATVSIRVNGINAQDYRLADGGAGARAAIVAKHLEHWTGLAAAHQVDLDRVVLVGHSRGGEGVDRAAIEIPLGAPYRIVGQVLVAPTDFGNQTAPYVPTVTLLPFCDGDVADLQGQRFTDGARDLTSDDTSLKSSVLVMGANHNYFNTEWTPGISVAPSFDDWGSDPTHGCSRKSPDRLTAKEQRAVGTAYVVGAVRLFADDEQDFLPLFDGTRVRVASTGDAQVLTHAIGGGRVLRKPGVGTGRSLPDGATTRFCHGSTAPGRQSSCGRTTRYDVVSPHWPAEYERVPTRQFLEMSWTAAGQSGGLVLDRPLDLGAGRLELRTVIDSRRPDADLRVRITDATGASALLTPAGGGVFPALTMGDLLTKNWAQTVVVDPSPATGVDLTRVVRVDLVAESRRGRLWVADLGVAPTSPPAVPARRTPVVNLSSMRIHEGDAPGTVTAELPFRIRGEVTRPARFVVATSGQTTGAVQRFAVDLAPGQRTGSIPIDYHPDRLDDYAISVTDLVAWPVSNLMTDSWNGRLVVVDDDPTPRFTVEPVARSVHEGDPVRWRVTLASRVDYELYVEAVVVRGPAPRLRAGDLPESWLEQYVGSVAPDTPLWAAHAQVGAGIRRDSRSTVIRIPTRRDGVAEPRESVTVKVRVGDRTVTRTVFVQASS